MLRANTNTLTTTQCDFLPQLKSIPERFVLYHSAALALRLGHRKIISFIFYANEPFAPQSLIEEIPYLKETEVLSARENFLSCCTNGLEKIRIDFYGNAGMNHIQQPDKLQDVGIKIASLHDLAAALLKRVQNGDKYRYYVDIDTLMQQQINLPQALAAARAVYGKYFLPHATVNAMTYYLEDYENYSLNAIIKNRLLASIKTVDTKALPTITANPGLY